MKTTNVTKIKAKAFRTAALVIVLILFISTFSACGDTNNNSTDELYKSGTEQNTSIYEESTKRDISTWGFNNIDDFSDENGKCILIKIDGYNAATKTVYNSIYYTYGYILQNGFFQELGDKRAEFPNDYVVTKGPWTYSVVNNEGISISGNGSILIQERIKVTDSVIIFKCQVSIDGHTGTEYLIPYHVVDWSTREEGYTGIAKHTCAGYSLK